MCGFERVNKYAHGYSSSGNLSYRALFRPRFYSPLFLMIALGLIIGPAHSDEELLTDELLTDEILATEDLDSDLLIDDGDDLLLEDQDLTLEENLPESASEQEDIAAEAARQHEALFAETRFPSAATCGTCHPKHYSEWSISQHSYSQLSPVYLSLSNKINQLANGSNGDFCLRCHNQVGANLGEDQFASNLERHPTSREGITCVVCHRIDRSYNKASGRLALVEGGVTEAVYGPEGNRELARVLDLSLIHI